jgi:hypothetical protein
MPAQYGNVKNSYILIHDSCRKIKQRIQHNKINRKKIINSKSKRSDSKIPMKTKLKQVVDENNYDSLIKEELTSDRGGATLYKVMVNNKQTIIPVSQDIHYGYRGKHLEDL